MCCSVLDSLKEMPTVKLQGLDAANPGGARWDSAREEVMAALKRYGCFEAVYHGVSFQLMDEVFDRAVPELFALPPATKTKANSSVDIPYQGYLSYPRYCSLEVQDAPNMASVEKFTSLMWPQGNPHFRDTVWNFAQAMKKLELVVERMVFEGFNVADRYEEYVASLTHVLRLQEYGAPLDQETKIAMTFSRFPNFVNIVGEKSCDGIVVQAEDGEWIRVEPLPHTWTVFIGEALGVLFNWRLPPAANHCVRVIRPKRYHTLFGSRPKNFSTVETLTEMVDPAHPLLYNPYNYGEYLKFRFSAEQDNIRIDTLKAFCGAGGAGTSG